MKLFFNDTVLISMLNFLKKILLRPQILLDNFDIEVIQEGEIAQLSAAIHLLACCLRNQPGLKGSHKSIVTIVPPGLAEVRLSCP
jgi:hypothetical protein